MGELLSVLILAFLQGVAEFLPISSSGHLVIAQNIFHVGEPDLRLDVFLHVGTLVSILLFYRKTVMRILKGLVAFDGESLKYVFMICISAVPAVALYLFAGDMLESLFKDPQAVGAFLMFTSAVLVAVKFIPQGTKKFTVSKAFWTGCAQAVALLPGVSRSGMTIVAAKAQKVSSGQAAEFSFLMSTPLIAGAALLQALKPQPETVQHLTSWGLVIVGAVVAAIVGYVSLCILVKALKSPKFWWFAPYCFFAGAATLAFAR